MCVCTAKLTIAVVNRIDCMLTVMVQGSDGLDMEVLEAKVVRGQLSTPSYQLPESYKSLNNGVKVGLHPRWLLQLHHMGQFFTRQWEPGRDRNGKGKKAICQETAKNNLQYLTEIARRLKHDYQLGGRLEDFGSADYLTKALGFVLHSSNGKALSSKRSMVYGVQKALQYMAEQALQQNKVGTFDGNWVDEHSCHGTCIGSMRPCNVQN